MDASIPPRALQRGLPSPSLILDKHECLDPAADMMVCEQPLDTAPQHRGEIDFTRPKHLKHRQKTHKPKTMACSCSVCSNFPQSDVLGHHHQSCKRAQQARRPPVKTYKRVSRACGSCRLSKVKCSGILPCIRCCARGQSDTCEFRLRWQPKPTGNEIETQGASDSPDQHDDPGTTEPVVDREFQSLGAPQQTPESLVLDMPGKAGDEPDVKLGFGTANMTPLPSSLLMDVAFSDTTTDVMDFTDLGTDVSFDLDPLDWGLLDNSMIVNGPTTVSSPGEALPSPATSISQHGHASSCQQPTPKLALPTGIGIMQISPLEAHRIRILRCLAESGLKGHRWESWFSLDNMSVFIRSYFSYFHPHTPLLHLPSWSVTTTSTRLIFSIALMGAMYSGIQNGCISEAKELCQIARSFAWKSDPDMQTKDRAQLDTIQAVYIAMLLEAFYFTPKGQHSSIALTRLVYEASEAGIFEPTTYGSDPENLKWSDWSAQECRTRTAFTLYLFDTIQAILFDRRAELHIYGGNLPSPCDEIMFSATTESEWRQLYLASRLSSSASPSFLSPD